MIRRAVWFALAMLIVFVLPLLLATVLLAVAQP